MDTGQRLFERPGNDVAGFVDVPQAVRFVEHDQISVDGLDVVGFGFRKLVRANHRTRRHQERIPAFLLADGVVALGLKNQTLQTEFVL